MPTKTLDITVTHTADTVTIDLPETQLKMHSSVASCLLRALLYVTDEDGPVAFSVSITPPYDCVVNLDGRVRLYRGRDVLFDLPESAVEVLCQQLTGVVDEL